jgi:hypothetical protein
MVFVLYEPSVIRDLTSYLTPSAIRKEKIRKKLFDRKKRKNRKLRRRRDTLHAVVFTDCKRLACMRLLRWIACNYDVAAPWLHVEDLGVVAARWLHAWRTWAIGALCCIHINWITVIYCGHLCSLVYEHKA